MQQTAGASMNCRIRGVGKPDEGDVQESAPLIVLKPNA